jgi:hypothetical protein
MAESRTALRLPRSANVRGDIAEARFIGKAMSVGFTVLRPFGNQEPYDFVLRISGRLTRVQVKSAWTDDGMGTFHFVSVLCRRSRRGAHPYSSKDVDFIVAYVAPADAWFVIPVGALRKQTQFSLSLGGRSRLGRYREKWELMA